MPRKGPIAKREILPDPIYNSRLVARFVNRLMYDGKKGPAETIFYRSLEICTLKPIIAHRLVATHIRRISAQCFHKIVFRTIRKMLILH